jgi:hypothetical protein
MATSGNFTTSKYNSKIGLKLSWTSSKDVANNRTRINWTLTSVGGSSGNWWMAGPVTATINGTKVVNTTSRFKLYGDGKYKKTGSLYVAHNADGTKSVSMSVKAAIYSSSVNCTGSKTYTLDKIDRFPYISAVTPTFSANSTIYPTVDYVNPFPVEQITAFRINVSYDEESISTNWVDADPTGSSFTFDSTTFPDSVRDSIIAAAPEGTNSITLTYRLFSIVNGNSNYSLKTGTMTFGNAEPTISGAQYYDVNEVTKSVMGSPYTDLVTTKSDVTVKFSSILPSAGAKIKHIRLVYGNRPDPGSPWLLRELDYSHTFSEPVDSLTDYTVNLGVIKTKTNGFITNFEHVVVGVDNQDLSGISVNYPAIGVIIVDTSGKVLRTFIPIRVYEYADPYAKITVTRRSNFYSETDVTVRCTYNKLENDLLQQRNFITIKCWYKKTSDADYDPTTETNLTDGVTTTLTLDNSYSWDILIAIKDSVNTTWTTYVYNVSAGVPIFFIDKLKKSVSVNCLPTRDDDFEISGASVLTHYESTEKCVGFWLDGRKVYERTETASGSIAANSWADLETLPDGVVIMPISITIWGSSSAAYTCCHNLIAQYVISSRKLRVLNTSDTAITVSAYRIQYVYVPAST